MSVAPSIKHAAACIATGWRIGWNESAGYYLFRVKTIDGKPVQIRTDFEAYGTRDRVLLVYKSQCFDAIFPKALHTI